MSGKRAATLDESREAGALERQRTAAIGFWSSTALAALAIIYLATLVFYFAIVGFVFPPSAIVQTVAGVITLVTAQLMVVVFSAIREVPGSRNLLGTISLSFTVLFAAVVSMNRFVQLTVIRQAPQGSATPDLARFVPYSTSSVMFAMEMLGWGFFMALAALAAAPLFDGDRLGRALRWTLVAYGALSLVSVLGYATETVLTMAGFIAWGPGLVVLGILLALHFRREGTRAMVDLGGCDHPELRAEQAL